jgi:ATP dependent DNA ligase domain
VRLSAATICDPYETLQGRAAILDGEIVTLDRRTGAPRFQLLQRRLAAARPRAVLQASGPASLWIFDILHLDGADLTQLPYLQRRAILEDLPLGQTKAIAVPPVWPDLAGDVLLDRTSDRLPLPLNRPPEQRPRSLRARPQGQPDALPRRVGGQSRHHRL